MNYPGGNFMGLSYVRFVVHYRDGKTVIEDRNIPKGEPSTWDLLEDKHDIIAVGVRYDPIPMWEERELTIPPQLLFQHLQLKEDSEKQQLIDKWKKPFTVKYRLPVLNTDGVQVRATFEEDVFKGSSKYYYPFYMIHDKTHTTGLGTSDNYMEIGLFISKEADCIIWRCYPGKRVKMFRTNIYSLYTDFQFNLHDIDLNRVGEPIEAGN